jgi:hyperosmotically inducible periplasmic protein
MKKLIPLLISSVLVMGALGCQNTAQTSTDAPDNPNANVESPDAQTAQENQNDATSETRRRQLDSDIRAREQRNNATGGDTDRADGDLESEVRSKLEANLPASQLGVEAEDGVVTITGTVPTQAQLQRVEPLAREIKGVSQVVNQVSVAPAKPNNVN